MGSQEADLFFLQEKWLSLYLSLTINIYFYIHLSLRITKIVLIDNSVTPDVFIVAIMLL